MRLSDLQTKEVVDVKDGKRVGVIIDVVIDNKNGQINGLFLEQSKNMRKLLAGRDEIEIKWNQILKIGEDIILIDTKVK